MSITNILLNIWDKFNLIWVAIRNFLSRHHLSFFFFAVWGCARTGVVVASLIFSSVRSALSSAQSALQFAVNSAPVVTVIHILDVANAFFPLYEAFILGVSLLVVRGAFCALNGIRYAYKQLPFKAT